MMRSLPLIALGVFTHVAAAQGCGRDSLPFFEFQVDEPAVFVADSAVRPRPMQERRLGTTFDSTAFLVQFVVDTLGRPDARSLQVLRKPPGASIEPVQVVIDRWRFRPAVARGCKVRQLVQALLER